MAARLASTSINESQSLLKFVSIETVIPSYRLVFWRPLLHPPSIFPTSGSVLCIRWLTYWSFNFNTSPSSEYSWLMSFRMDLCDLLAVQRIVKSLLQPHSSNISILWHSAVFTVQLSHPHVTTGETIACSRWTFIGKVCLCFLICCLG